MRQNLTKIGEVPVDSEAFVKLAHPHGKSNIVQDNLLRRGLNLSAASKSGNTITQTELQNTGRNTTRLDVTNEEQEN